MNRWWRQVQGRWDLFRVVMTWEYVSSTQTRDWERGEQTMRIELRKERP